MAVAFDVDAAFEGLSAGEAAEKMADAQGNPTARITIAKVDPSVFAASCMRSRDGDVVEIDYAGAVDGVQFDARRRFATMLGSGEVVKGLELGLFEMCIGERRVVRVPPRLGFGSRGSRVFGVPADATLEFDVTLRSINLQDDPAVRREDLDFEQRFK